MYSNTRKEPAVYVLASTPNGTLYVGVTSELYERMILHRSGTYGGFTAKYRVTRLVYVEYFATMDEAITREKRLKKWNRLWKIRLIETQNPTWADLFDPDEGVAMHGPHSQAEAQRT